MPKCLHFLVATVLLLAFLLTGCGASQSAKDIYLAFAQKYPLPAGHMFDSALPERNPDCFTYDQFHHAFALQDGSDGWAYIDHAVFWQNTTSQKIEEIAIFSCHDRGGAEAVAAICQNRMKLLCSMRHYVDVSATEGATITIYGKTVVCLVLRDNAKAKKIMDGIF
ncbi:MAG: hypothetical protein J6R42_01670 [Clostridia bacterium]|nr:hypothetical protein [Clostridia bacterium]